VSLPLAGSSSCRCFCFVRWRGCSSRTSLTIFTQPPKKGFVVLVGLASKNASSSSSSPRRHHEAAVPRWRRRCKR